MSHISDQERRRRIGVRHRLAPPASISRELLPVAVALPPLAGLAGLVLILAALILVETTLYAQARRNLRDT